MPYRSRETVVKMVAAALLGFCGSMLSFYLGHIIGLRSSTLIFLFEVGFGAAFMLLGIRRWFVPSPIELKGSHLIFLFAGAGLIVIGSFLAFIVRIGEV